MSKPVCKFFAQGRCTHGDSCKFAHTQTNADLGSNTDPGAQRPNNSKPNKQRPRPHKLVKVNTETFEPWYEPPHMQVQVLNPATPNPNITESDIFILPGLFDGLDQSIYTQLLDEIESSGKDLNELWKGWHGNTHLIADDHLQWKKSCPVFNSIIDRIAQFFQMDVKATRFNLYEDLHDFKPMHFDAAAIDPKKALTQNLTVGVSFGYTRSIEFEHAVTRSRVSFPLPNGTVYGFGKQVNIDWRHGIPPIKPEVIKSVESTIPTGRISIILWGKSNQSRLAT
jgi:hypothetical protein